MTKREVLNKNRWLFGGRVEAEEVREADPDGLSVKHDIVVLPRRQIDVLLERQLISQDQHTAGEKLRDWWERAGMEIGRVKAKPLEKTSPSQPEIIRNEGAWKNYRLAMEQCGQWRLALRCIVIEDMTPHDFGCRLRCAGLASLCVALDRLLQHMKQTGYFVQGKWRDEKPAKLGRGAGGLTTAARMTPEQLHERAKKASAARWHAEKNKM